MIWFVFAIVTTVLLLLGKHRIFVVVSGAPYPITAEVRIKVLLLIPIKLRLALELDNGGNFLHLFSRMLERHYGINKLRGMRSRGLKVKGALKLRALKIVLREGFAHSPDLTALICGGLNAVVTAATPIINFPDRFEFKIYPYFQSSKFCFTVYCIMEARLADIILAAIKNRIRSVGRGKTSH